MTIQFTTATLTPDPLSFQSSYLPESCKAVSIAKEVYICHYNYNSVKNTCEWLLTTDKMFASETDQSFELASYEDLLPWAAATNEVFEKAIVVEGNVEWKEEEYIDFCGKTDIKCGYDIIW
jgi:hypothetical protein